MENLHISGNKKYLMKGDKPFFWLGDTAWMLFTNISYEEAYTYLKNRADKGFNVIQSVLIYSVDTTEALKTVNRMCCKNTAVDTDKYWHNIDMVIKLAEELELYMAIHEGSGEMLHLKKLMESVDFTSGKSMYWMSPVTGVYSYIGKCVGDTFTARKPERYEEDNADRVLVIS